MNHARILYAYLARLKDADLEAIRDARREAVHAWLNLGNWSQIKAQDKHMATIQTALGNLTKHDIKLIEEITMEAINDE